MEDTRRQSIIAPELKDILSPEDTKKSFENVESVLQELKMSFNIGDRDEEEAGGSEEEMQKRAEERKKKEQEARRNREKARNTKDPRRRVAAMLEQGRDWGQARPDQVRDRKVKVPMQVYTSLHATGAERIEMVDVHTLQGRCKGLSAGSCNYREVRNLAEEEERQAKWLNATAPLEPKDFIRENKAQLGYYTDMHEESRYRAELFEAKLKLAKKRKERADEAKSEQKIAMMCGRRRFMKGPGLFNEVLSGYLRRISPNKEAPSGKQQEEEGKPARIWTAVRGSVMEAVEYKWKDRRRKVVQQAAAKRASFPELLRRHERGLRLRGYANLGSAKIQCPDDDGAFAQQDHRSGGLSRSCRKIQPHREADPTRSSFLHPTKTSLVQKGFKVMDTRGGQTFGRLLQLFRKRVSR